MSWYAYVVIRYVLVRFVTQQVRCKSALCLYIRVAVEQTERYERLS